MYCNINCGLGIYYFFILLVLFLIIFLITVGIRELVVRVKLSRSGVKVDGHITDYFRGRNSYLTYDYDYNGLTYSRKESVGYYSKLFNEDKVSVSCLPENPKTARLGYKIPASMVGKGIAMALILIGIAVVIIMLAIAIMFILMGIHDFYFFNSH